MSHAASASSGVAGAPNACSRCEPRPPRARGVRAAQSQVRRRDAGPEALLPRAARARDRRASSLRARTRSRRLRRDDGRHAAAAESQAQRVAPSRARSARRQLRCARRRASGANQRASAASSGADDREHAAQESGVSLAREAAAAKIDAGIETRVPIARAFAQSVEQIRVAPGAQGRAGYGRTDNLHSVRLKWRRAHSNDGVRWAIRA